MRMGRSSRLSCAAMAGLTLAAAGLAGSATVALAGVGAGPRSSAARPGGIISTIAGGPGSPGPATSISISSCDVHYAHGYLYIGDGSFVRRVSVATDELTTVAGNGAGGPTANGGPATRTAIGSACGTAVDAAGNLVIADGGVQVLASRTGTFYGQKMTAGHIYAVPAGNSFANAAVDVAVDRRGNLVIALTGTGSCDLEGNCYQYGAGVEVLAVRTGTFYGQRMTAGDLYLVAGGGSPGSAGDGGPATQAWLGTTIGAVQLDPAGNVVVAAGGQCCGQAINDPSYLDTVQVIAEATGTFYGQKMTAGDIYTVAGGGSGGNGGPATRASLQQPEGIAIDHAGNVLIADESQVRVVAVRSGTFYGQKMTAGHIYRLAGVPGYPGFFGDGGPASRSKVDAIAVSIDGTGNVVFVNGVFTNRSGVTTVPRVRVIAARSGSFYGRPMKAGYIYTVAGNGSALGLSGLKGPARSAQIGSADSIGADAAGDVAFCSNGTLLVIPAHTSTFYGGHMTAGHVYALARPGCAGGSVALDGSGNIVVAGTPVLLVAVRSGRFFGRAMTAGHSYAIGASAGAVAVDHRGNALLVDGNRVKVIAASTGAFYGRRMYAGETYTVAGDGWPKFNGDGELATKTNMQPQDVAADDAGNLFVTDWNLRIRVVAARTGTMYGQKMTAGHVYTIAGHGGYGFSGSGGPATAADIGGPAGVAVAASGIVLFADPSNGVVWAVAARTGRFYGQQMNAGDIYVAAGGGTQAPGDGGRATSAILSPNSVAISPAGDLLLTDGIRLRAVSP